MEVVKKTLLKNKIVKYEITVEVWLLKNKINSNIDNPMEKMYPELVLQLALIYPFCGRPEIE